MPGEEGFWVVSYKGFTFIWKYTQDWPMAQEMYANAKGDQVHHKQRKEKSVKKNA